MTLRVRIPPARWVLEVAPEDAVVVGRGRDADVRVGHELVQGRWTVSKHHAEIRWDGIRWTTTNVSTKPGLLHVYEPGYEEMPLEPGRGWTPARHRWSYALGSAGHRFHVVCETDDHDALLPVLSDVDDDPTVGLDLGGALQLTDLEREAVLAYYGAFGALPRPEVLEPATHDAAVVQVGRSRDSLRKALERINEKVAGMAGAPASAAGRNVSADIGRWLARLGFLDPE